ncbi:MAG: HAD family acid phosphatase [Acidobacteriota bacterium]
MTVRSTGSLLVLVLLLSAGCAARGMAPPSAPVPASASPSGAMAAAPDPDSIRWVRDAAEYHAALYQVYRLATAHVEAEAAGRQPGTWAVILDADETVISNVVYQQERARQGLGYSAESWRAWVARREATPLPGAAAFLARVRALGGRIAIVTNRLQSECEDTAAVFSAHALPYDALLCRPDGGPSDKNPRFEAVRTGKSPASPGPVDVVAFLGDNIQDFPSLTQKVKAQGAAAFQEFGARYFVVPNPMYGSWQ